MTKMVLTEEQTELIRKNRERALGLQKKRKQESVAAATVEAQGNNSNNKKNRGGNDPPGEDNNSNTNKNDDIDDDEPMEDFEIGASSHVSKEKAKRLYCLPDGTLEVCSFVEKENPRNKGFQPMKLYERKELRRRSRERYGGLEGLQEERRRREEKRFQNDLERTKDIFRR